MGLVNIIGNTTHSYNNAADGVIFPSVQASGLTIIDVTDTTQDLTLVRGDGQFVLVVRKTGGEVDMGPVNNTIYNVGDDLGSGNIVACVGTATSFTVSSLTPDTDTYYKAYEYNVNGSKSKYLLASPPTTHQFTFTAEYQDVIDYAVSQGWSPPPTLAGKFADNNLVKKAIAINLFANAPRFYNFHTTGSQEYACIDYKSPSDATLATLVNSPTHTQKGGFTGNGTTSYINSNWTPSTHGAGLFTQNDAGVISYVGTDSLINSADFGGRSAADGNMVFLNSKDIVSAPDGRINMIGNVISRYTVVPTSVGLYIQRRTNDTTQTLTKDNVSLGSLERNSTGLPIATIFCLGINTGGVLTSPTTRRLDSFIPFKQSAVGDTDIYNMWTEHRTRTAAV